MTLSSACTSWFRPRPDTHEDPRRRMPFFPGLAGADQPVCCLRGKSAVQLSFLRWKAGSLGEESMHQVRSAWPA
jgi:hypothetical protein